MEPLDILMSALTKNDGDNDKVAKAKYRPDPEAQAMELRQRYPYFAQKYDFKPGDLVRDKPGIGIFKEESRIVFVVIRWLDPDNSPYDVALIKQALHEKHMSCFAMPLDIVVGNIVQSEGSMLSLDVVSSQQLEPATPEILANWTARPKE